MEQQGVGEPPEGVPGQQAECFLTQVQVCVEVSGDKEKLVSGNFHFLPNEPEMSS